MDKIRQQFEVNGKISDELYEWLLARERVLKVRDKFYEEGGHIMLKSSVYDPDALDEPLRSQALDYFKDLKK